MLILADTNILIRRVNRHDLQHKDARSALRHFSTLEYQVCIVPQNILEFWNVATRPLDKNGLGLMPRHVERIVARFEQLYQILPENPDVYPLWRNLVAKYSVSGLKAYDTRIVASAMVYGITKILTFNTADFRRYSEIEVLDPKLL